MEHRPESAQQLPDQVEALRCVTLPAIPTVYGLEEPEDGVTAWVFALPGGRAYIVPSHGGGTRMIHTSLDMVERRWAPLRDTQLVMVATT